MRVPPAITFPQANTGTMDKPSPAISTSAVDTGNGINGDRASGDWVLGDRTLFDRQGLLSDLLAGFAIFCLSVPTSLAISVATGAPLAAGILAGIFGGLVVGLSGGSRTCVTGASPALIGVTITQVAALGSFDRFFIAVIVAGAIQIGIGMLKLGFLVSFVPRAVVRGSIASLGVILLLKEVPHLVGHHGNPQGEFSFIQPDAQTTFSALSQIPANGHAGAAVIGLLSVALLAWWDRRPARLRPLPGALVVVALAVGLQFVFQTLGGPWRLGEGQLLPPPAAWGIGSIYDLGKPCDWALMDNNQIYISGVILALAATLETLLGIRATDHLDPRRRRTLMDDELIAQGSGNLLCGWLGGLPLAPLVVHSQAGIDAGAQTNRATIFNGVFLVAVVVLMTPLIGFIPLPALAAILFVTGLRLIKRCGFWGICAGGWVQVVPFFATLIATLFTDPLIGVLVGLGVSITAILTDNMLQPLPMRVEKLDDTEVIRIELPPRFDFLGTGALDRALDEIPQGSRVILEACGLDHVDTEILGLIDDFRLYTAPQRRIEVTLLGFSDAEDSDAKDKEDAAEEQEPAPMADRGDGDTR
jgi:carbonic anhydrase/SulP family sulfate permease